jgi:hypothetical protein
MNNIFDTNGNIDLDKIQRAYNRYTYGGTTRYKSNAYVFLQDEFHPYWHTLKKVGDKHYELKVNIQTFNMGCNNQLDFSDSIWFDVYIKKAYIEAVCQLNSDICFLILGEINKKYSNMFANESEQLEA